MEQDFLKNRAKKFYKNAVDLLNNETYDLAAFNFEQSAQLYLKYFLFTKIKDFPRIHSAGELLVEIKKVHSFPEKVEKFINENQKIIIDLEECYLTSRYLPASFFKDEVLLMKNFIENLEKLLFENEQ